MKPKLDDVSTGSLDVAGGLIERVYSKSGTFAVYGTVEGVHIHYADDDDLSRIQRLDLAYLNPLRGEIDGLVREWRSGLRHNLKIMAQSVDRRVADALDLALQGERYLARDLLEQIKAEILIKRASLARSRGLIVSAASAAFIAATAAAATTDLARNLLHLSSNEGLLLAAGGAGAVGSLFSLAIGYRTAPSQVEGVGNIIDPILHIFVGAISAVILTLIVITLVPELDIGGGLASRSDPDGRLGNAVLGPLSAPAAVLAFIGGFAERLVPDLLRREFMPVGQTRLAQDAMAPPSLIDVAPLTAEDSVSAFRDWSQQAIVLATQATISSVRKIEAACAGVALLCLYFLLVSPPTRPFTIVDLAVLIAVMLSSALVVLYDHMTEREARRLQAGAVNQARRLLAHPPSQVSNVDND